MAVFLMFSNVGLAVNIHYCKNVIAEVSYGYVSESSCAKLKSTGKPCCIKKQGREVSNMEPCCKEEVVKQKADSQQIIVKTTQIQLDAFLSPEVYVLPLANYDVVSFPKKTYAAFYCNSNAPPLYKLYSQYILYA